MLQVSYNVFRRLTQWQIFLPAQVFIPLSRSSNLLICFTRVCICSYTSFVFNDTCIIRDIWNLNEEWALIVWSMLFLQSRKCKVCSCSSSSCWSYESSPIVKLDFKRTSLVWGRNSPSLCADWLVISMALRLFQL